jgi:hypothetical protein
MSRIDSLKETQRGIGLTCRCGKLARVTARGQTFCYECFDEAMGYILDPEGHAKRRKRERGREVDRAAAKEKQMRKAQCPKTT